MARTVDRDVLLGFIEEVKGYLPQIRKDLESLRTNPHKVDSMEEMFRLLHSIKGAASMVGLSALSHIAYYPEEALQEIAAGKLEWNQHMAAALAMTISHIESYLDGALSGKVRERPLVAEVVTAFRRLWGRPESGDQAEIDALVGAEESRPSVAESTEPPPAPTVQDVAVEEEIGRAHV